VKIPLSPARAPSALDFPRFDGAEIGRDLLRALIILVVAWLLYRLVALLTRRIEAFATRSGDQSRLTDAEQRGRTLADLVRSVARAVITSVALLLVLNLFIDVRPLLAGAGIVTLALSFGAQGLVKDVIVGFFVLLEDQFRVGDTIRVSGVEGQVQHMTLRMVTLRDGQGIVHFVPNGGIAVVSNLTRDWSRALVDVGVAYHEDIDRVLAVLRRVVKEFAHDPAWADIVIGEPTVAGVQRLGDGGVDVRLWVNVRPGRQSEAERELRRRIKQTLDGEGIALAVSRRVHHITDFPPGPGGR